MKTLIADGLIIRGEFSIKVWKHLPDGRKILVDAYRDHNLVVNSGRALAAHHIAGDTLTNFITQVAFGTNGADPLPSDTQITGALIRDIDNHEYPAANSVQFNWGLPVDQGNGMEISEFGLLCVDGTLFARKTRAKPLNKEDDLSIEGHWTIQF
jgi:hypothetical protein